MTTTYWTPVVLLPFAVHGHAGAATNGITLSVPQDQDPQCGTIKKQENLRRSRDLTMENPEKPGENGVQPWKNHEKGKTHWCETQGMGVAGMMVNSYYRIL